MTATTAGENDHLEFGNIHILNNVWWLTLSGSHASYRRARIVGLQKRSHNPLLVS